MNHSRCAEGWRCADAMWCRHAMCASQVHRRRVVDGVRNPGKAYVPLLSRKHFDGVWKRCESRVEGTLQSERQVCMRRGWRAEGSSHDHTYRRGAGVCCRMYRASQIDALGRLSRGGRTEISAALAAIVDVPPL